MESYRYTYFMWTLIFLCCRCIPQSVTMINVVSHFYEPYFEIPRARCIGMWSLNMFYLRVYFYLHCSTEMMRLYDGIFQFVICEKLYGLNGIRSMYKYAFVVNAVWAIWKARIMHTMYCYANPMCHLPFTCSSRIFVCSMRWNATSINSNITC